MNNRWFIILGIVLLLTASTGIPLNSLSANLISLDNQVLHTEMSLFEMQKVAKHYLLSANNPIKKLYGETSTQWLVEEYFAKKVGSKELANTVLLYTTENNLPISIVFALVFVESSYSMRAVNHNVSSQDYGLFQLNSQTFRHIAKKDIFHLETNVQLGTSYLAYAFSLDPDPKMALSIYNAGPSRPLRGLTPASTIKYVDKILNYSYNINTEFYNYVWKRLKLAEFDQDNT